MRCSSLALQYCDLKKRKKKYLSRPPVFPLDLGELLTLVMCLHVVLKLGSLALLSLISHICADEKLQPLSLLESHFQCYSSAST